MTLTGLCVTDVCIKQVTVITILSNNPNLITNLITNPSPQPFSLSRSPLPHYPSLTLIHPSTPLSFSSLFPLSLSLSSAPLSLYPSILLLHTHTLSPLPLELRLLSAADCLPAPFPGNYTQPSGAVDVDVYNYWRGCTACWKPESLSVSFLQHLTTGLEMVITVQPGSV